MFRLRSEQQNQLARIELNSITRRDSFYDPTQESEEKFCSFSKIEVDIVTAKNDATFGTVTFYFQKEGKDYLRVVYRLSDLLQDIGGFASSVFAILQMLLSVYQVLDQ